MGGRWDDDSKKQGSFLELFSGDPHCEIGHDHDLEWIAKYCDCWLEEESGRKRTSIRLGDDRRQYGLHRILGTAIRTCCKR
jgi:hypothetical protein